jgi:acyl phosphate:glycerol-3-phosphate acyltransferase
MTWGDVLPYIVLVLGLSYLLGSIPFGLLLTRAAGIGDLRQIGSGNIGATNVLRTGRKDLAALTLLLDGAKGTLAVLLAERFGPDLVIFGAFGALVGHLNPVWLKFAGGKGVATYLGILFGLSWPMGLLFAALWLATALAFRMSSLAAIVATVLTSAAGWILSAPDTWRALMGEYDFLLLTRQKGEGIALLAILVIMRHRENIVRIWRREEPRIGERR